LLKPKNCLSGSLSQHDIENFNISEEERPDNNKKYQSRLLFSHIEECEFEESNNIGLNTKKENNKNENII